MRKPAKAKIQAALKDYEAWRVKVDVRLAKLSKQAQQFIGQWADDVRQRITDGELGICTQALIWSVVRAIKDFESGFYTNVTMDGMFTCRGFDDSPQGQPNDSAHGS